MRTRFIAAAVPYLFLACAGARQHAADAARPAAADEDAHHIVPGDWFVTQEAYQSGRIAVHLSQLLTAPSDATRGEGEYLLYDGNKIWTKYQYRTRPATRDDLAVGAIVIVADKNQEGLYRIADSREEVRRIGWFMGTITDLHKNEVGVSGYKARPEALRVIVPR